MTFEPVVATAPPYGLALVSDAVGNLSLRSSTGGVMPDARGRFLTRVTTGLLTRRGTSVVRETFGTSLLDDAALGLWRTVGAVRRSFAFALMQLRPILIQGDAVEEDEDGRLGEILLTEVVFTSAVSATLRINVRTEGDVRRGGTGTTEDLTI